MTKPAVVIPSAPDAPGILHVDTGAALYGPTPTHDVGHEADGSTPGRLGDVSLHKPTADTASTETIRHLAYALWEARGRPHGSSDIDWIAAEREVTGRHGAVMAHGKTAEVSDGLGLMKSATADDRNGLVNPQEDRGSSRSAEP